MIVAPATLADIPQLVELLDVLFQQEAELCPDARLQAQGLRLILESPHVGAILVLRHGEQVVGMANLLYSVSTAMGSRVAWLEDVVVHPAFRGQGHGTRLLQAVLEHAEQAGCQRVSLLTDASNTRAQALYQRHGFVASTMIPFRRQP